MTETQTETNVPEFPLTQEEAARLNAELSKEGKPVATPEPKFYSIGVVTAVNKVVNVRVFYEEHKAKKFARQARIMGAMFYVERLKNESDEKEFLEMARLGVSNLGQITIDTNPKDLVMEEGEPKPVENFAQKEVAQEAT